MVVVDITRMNSHLKRTDIITISCSSEFAIIVEFAKSIVWDTGISQIFYLPRQVICGTSYDARRCRKIFCRFPGWFLALCSSGTGCQYEMNPRHLWCVWVCIHVERIIY